MAKTLQYFLISTVFILFTLVTATETHSFSRKLSPEKIGLKEEKLTHLHFYVHDLNNGKNPSVIRIINSTTNSSLGFGAMLMVDDPLTTEPDINSKVIGRAQGLLASDSQNDIEYAMLFNFVFLEDKYNGSTLSLLGRNAIFSEIREMPIVGGSKVFRFARGYAHAKTYSVDLATLNAIIEYNIYVFHY